MERFRPSLPENGKKEIAIGLGILGVMYLVPAMRVPFIALLADASLVLGAAKAYFINNTDNNHES